MSLDIGEKLKDLNPFGKKEAPVGQVSEIAPLAPTSAQAETAASNINATQAPSAVETLGAPTAPASSTEQAPAGSEQIMGTAANANAFPTGMSAEPQPVSPPAPLEEKPAA